MRIYLFLFFTLFCFKVNSQTKHKSVIDSTTLSNWTTIGSSRETKVSNDGNYVTYTFSKNKVNKRILQSLKDNSIVAEFRDASMGFFTPDNAKLIYYSKDTIYYFDIMKRSTDKIANVKKLFVPKTNDNNFIIYQLKGPSNELIVQSLIDQKEMRIRSVSRYGLNRNEKRLVILTSDMNTKINSVKIIDLENLAVNTILELKKEENIESFNFDESGQKLAFVVNARHNNENSYSLWCFDNMTKTTEIKASNSSPEISKNESLCNLTPFFTGDGKYIFFKIEEKTTGTKLSSLSKVNIWNYKDLELQSVQKDQKPRYTCSVDVATNKVIHLENDLEKLLLMSYGDIRGDYVIVVKNQGDRFWETDNLNYNWKVSMKDGNRSKIEVKSGATYFYSPNGKYLLFYGHVSNKSDYYLCDLESDKIINISKNIPKGWLAYDDGTEGSERSAPIGVAAWIDNEETVLVYDNFDLWRLSLKQSFPPENVTNGYGRRSHTRLRLVNNGEYVNMGDTLLLNAFDWKNKFNGFYKKRLNEKGDPDSLSMKPWIVNLNGNWLLPVNHELENIGMVPLKVKNKELWLVQGSSPSEAPNYFTTKDFVSYERVTNIQPQSNVNWYTSELVNWEGADGRSIRGILYKPEDFDPTKKYPVIIYQYRLLTQRLYAFLEPHFMSGPINIPLFVSRGYLVLTPDIAVRRGAEGSGPASLDVLTSAAKWLGKLPYVEKNSIGLNGHSRGGFQTNYAVANSNLFAAALSGAGGADQITSAFFLSKNGSSRLKVIEKSLGNLWEHREAYLQGSPLLKANKVNTPLLLFHSKNDGAVPFELSVQYFVALRRLNKSVWMLDYDDGDHELLQAKDYRDYTLRATQFFDHYLKGTSAPSWMTLGVPARLKGIATGLELDSEGSKSLLSNPYLKN